MRNKTSAAPTMKDVAAEAGVALGTVSKVFNDLPVRPESRRKVLDAARKLLELGCHKLLFLRLGTDVASEADKRRAGFEAVCREGGVSFESLSVQNEESFAPFDAFLDAYTHDGVFDYDGVFCNTDRLCYEIEKRLRARGVRVPDDVQMIGFDGPRRCADDRLRRHLPL